MNKGIIYVSILVLISNFCATKSIAQNENRKAAENKPIYHSPGGTYSPAILRI